MADDIVTRLTDLLLAGEQLLREHADEIERLRNLIKAFVSAWERSELGDNNGTEYFNAVHAMRMELKKYE